MTETYRTTPPPFEVQEAEYEFMRIDGKQDRGPFRTISAKWTRQEAINDAKQMQREHSDRIYRVIDTREPA